MSVVSKCAATTNRVERASGAPKLRSCAILLPRRDSLRIGAAGFPDWRRRGCRIKNLTPVLLSRTTSADESHEGYPRCGLFHGSSRLIRLCRSDRRDLTCGLAFSPLTCTERPTGTTNSSHQSSGIVLLPYSSVEICFLAQRSRQFNSDMKILFKTILSQLSQESVMS